MSLPENSVLAAPPHAALPLTAQPLAASDMHWEWVATNSQRILELALSHLYQGVVPVAQSGSESSPMGSVEVRRPAGRRGGVGRGPGAAGSGVGSSCPGFFCVMPHISVPSKEASSGTSAASQRAPASSVASP